MKILIFSKRGGGKNSGRHIKIDLNQGEYCHQKMCTLRQEYFVKLDCITNFSNFVMKTSTSNHLCKQIKTKQCCVGHYLERKIKKRINQLPRIILILSLYLGSKYMKLCMCKLIKGKINLT